MHHLGLDLSSFMDLFEKHFSRFSNYNTSLL